MSEEDLDNSPAYYAILPAHIRYCKDLEMGARLLYAEITALCNKHGYCWAKNKYFAELYGVDESTIKRWLNSLKEMRFLHVVVEKQGFITKRRMWIIDENQIMFTKGQKCTPRELKNEPPTGSKMSYINNTSNNTSNNKERERASAPPAQDLFIQDQVKMPSHEYTKLCLAYGSPKVDQYVKRLNEYAKMKPKKFAEYGDHATVIEKWMREDEEKRPTAPTASTDSDEDLRVAVERIFNDSSTVIVGYNYIEFISGPYNVVRVTIGDKGFREQVVNNLRKLGYGHIVKQITG